MHNGKKERIITRTTITILLKTTKLLQTTTNYESQSTYHNKENQENRTASGQSQQAARCCLATEFNRERQCSVQFRILLQPEIVARQNDLRGNESKKNQPKFQLIFYIYLFEFIFENKNGKKQEISHTLTSTHTHVYKI